MMLAGLFFVAYVVIGAVYARSQAMACYRRASEWTGESTRRESVMMQQAWRALLWWYAIPYDAVHGPIYRWLTKPIHDHNAHIEQLYADRNSWHDKLFDTDASPAERGMAQQLYEFCDNEIKRLEAG